MVSSTHEHREYVRRHKFSVPVNKEAVEQDWVPRGYSCDLFVDPPGKEWRDFTHEQDELVVVVSGHMQFTIDQEVVQLEPGDECEAQHQECGSWRGAVAVRLLLSLAALPRTDAATLTFGNKTHGWAELMTWKPRSMVLHGFLSDAECDHVIQVANPQLARSKVVAPDGKSVLDDIRTSSGTFINTGHDEVIAAIEQRVALLTHLEAPNQEHLQVLRYEHGQKYSAHWDVNDSPKRLEQMAAKGVLGGLRTATLLMYLSDVQEGGETAFPHGKWLDKALQAQPPYTECASTGVAVKPRKGDATLFYSLRLDDAQKKDVYSLHAGCPVIEGTKYSATKWIHVEHFGHSPAAAAAQPPARCQDLQPECTAWAAQGECTANARYMVGDETTAGACRLACGACRACQPGDVLCERENERTAR
ncbi:putative prolyl 4-hydroxylase 4 [Chlorella vulgaris]